MGDVFHSELLSYQRVFPLFVGYISLYIHIYIYSQEIHMSTMSQLYLHYPIIIFRSKYNSLHPYHISLYPTNQCISIIFHDISIHDTYKRVDHPIIVYPYVHFICPFNNEIFILSIFPDYFHRFPAFS